MSLTERFIYGFERRLTRAAFISSKTLILGKYYYNLKLHFSI